MAEIYWRTSWAVNPTRKHSSGARALPSSWSKTIQLQDICIAPQFDQVLQLLIWRLPTLTAHHRDEKCLRRVCDMRKYKTAWMVFFSFVHILRYSGMRILFLSRLPISVILVHKAGSSWFWLRGNALFAAEESCSRTIGMSGLLSLNSKRKPFSLILFSGWFD